MILLDYPYTSDFLIETVVKNQFPVVATKEAKEILRGKNANLISEENAITWFMSNQGNPVYTNSENSIAWIQQNLKGTSLPEKIETFKNKFKFRELIQEAYPDYFFKSASLSELGNLDITGFKFPFIVKPAVGFFSIAVHKVDKPEDWPSIVNTIEKQIEKTKSLYPKEVVSNTDFIIEEYIHGDEYAFDCYFDEKGEPVILNVLHHVFTSENDVSDRVYSSSMEVIYRLYQPIMDFLIVIGSKIDLRNFPLHIEFRESEPGKINPIEVNPMRFGGWCTTADLTWFSYGINSYEFFFHSKRPDWEEVFENRKNKKYSLILLDNQSDVPQEDIDYFDFEAIAKDFEQPLACQKCEYGQIRGFRFSLY
jgi:hypothetical protein